MSTRDTTPAPREPLVRWFSVIAIVEALTWAGLLIGMYFKYIPESTTEIGVKIFGPIHGAVFVAYVVETFLVSWKLRWRLFSWTTFFALAASIPPFFTVLFEIWARKTGRLEVRTEAPEPERVGV
ncbi:DUF3817 domain-containing protein [Phytomonospora endophytica]|uniref:Integral membrane protein n=1 Tax=Phytomonospora endophytica TaxID=714109 RepID=A0A841FST4_9ACTN|nr:DUF3817 domain-containing protein [Phytomonospora endophytica]MBB6035040.1 integral membrane protein [Phytomonospora endophytica]GIG68294.1 hypothetical protein Pen01_45890 [Phytomonospora endophytica]